jgi:hypothetical protein
LPTYVIQDVHRLITCSREHFESESSAKVCEENDNGHSTTFVIFTLFPFNFKLHYYYYYYYYYY